MFNLVSILVCYSFPYNVRPRASKTAAWCFRHATKPNPAIHERGKHMHASNMGDQSARRKTRSQASPVVRHNLSQVDVLADVQIDHVHETWQPISRRVFACWLSVLIQFAQNPQKPISWKHKVSQTYIWRNFYDISHSENMMIVFN